MRKVFEKSYAEDASAKDGGFVFQAIISHDIKWEIEEGETRIDPKKINAMLHQVDAFPDMKFNSGGATLTYVILSEVNILRRKFELASEAIKKRINPAYAAEVSQAQQSSQNRKALNQQYFKNTYFEVTLTTDHIVLREVSTSGLNSGIPKVTLKLSTGLVDTLDGQKAGTWEQFNLKVDGTSELTISGVGENSLSTIKEKDDVENIEDVIFMTIVPSLILEFKGDQVPIDTYSNRSSQVSFGGDVDYKDLFKVEDTTKEVEPVEKEEDANQPIAN